MEDLSLWIPISESLVFISAVLPGEPNDTNSMPLLELKKWPSISFSKPFKHLFLWFLTAEGKQGSLSIYGRANTCKDPLRLLWASANVRFLYATSGHWRLTAFWLAICLPDSFAWSVKWRVLSFWGGLNI